MLSDNIHWREVILIAVGVVLGAILAALLSSAITEGAREKISRMEKSPRIFDTSTLEYAIKTRHGDVALQGSVRLNPVRFNKLLTKSYGYIKITTERYTRHTREVCEGSGKDRKCRTEVYYSWDTYRNNYYIDDTFYFMGVSFNTEEIDPNPQTKRLKLSKEVVSPDYQNKISGNYIYESSSFWVSVGDLRYLVYVVDEEYQASLFINFSYDGNIYNFENQVCGCFLSSWSIDDTISSEKTGVQISIFFSYLSLIILCAGVGYFVAENTDFLE